MGLTVHTLERLNGTTRKNDFILRILLLLRIILLFLLQWGLQNYREFFTPEPSSRTANYYPRYGINLDAGSLHVSYLSRPCISYNVPSRYGFSKFITVRKM